MTIREMIACGLIEELCELLGIPLGVEYWMSK